MYQQSCSTSFSLLTPHSLDDVSYSQELCPKLQGPQQLAHSCCSILRQRCWLQTNWYASLDTNRYTIDKLTHWIGLRYDDLISEENELVQEALRRLEIAEPREMYDRAYRIRVAQQCSLTHSLLPKSQWVTAETVSINDNNNSGWDSNIVAIQDKRYLRPYIDEVAAEFAERGDFDNIKVTPRH